MLLIKLLASNVPLDHPNITVELIDAIPNEPRTLTYTQKFFR